MAPDSSPNVAVLSHSPWDQSGAMNGAPTGVGDDWIILFTRIIGPLQRSAGFFHSRA